MGVGKSAVGRSTARSLRMRFSDVDWAIEKAEGRTIKEIFETEGEASFREKERTFIESGHPESGMVIACGGGLPLQPGMHELLNRKGIVICLFAKVETILKRTSGNTRRPLLNVENPEEKIRELMAVREPIYMKTGIGVSTDGRSINDIVSSIRRIYDRERGKWPSTK